MLRFKEEEEEDGGVQTERGETDQRGNKTVLNAVPITAPAHQGRHTAQGRHRHHSALITAATPTLLAPHSPAALGESHDTVVESATVAIVWQWKVFLMHQQYN